MTRACALGFTFAVEVGGVHASEVGLALIDLEAREVIMVLGEMHLVTKHEAIAGGAPFSESLASVRDGDFFRSVPQSHRTVTRTKGLSQQVENFA